MKWNRMRVAMYGALAAAVAAVAGTAYAAPGRSHAPSNTNASGTLVVDRSFEIKTSDPQRAFEPTASLTDRGIYDTLFTCKGGDIAHPIPLLVKSWSATKDAKTLTFHLKKNVHFANGTRLTSADVVFSFRRLVNLKGNPAFLLAGTTTRAKDKYTVVVHSKDPASQLPSILANTSTGIVNSKLVRKHGGTAAASADKTDKAEAWFNSSASLGAGSGPYVLKTYSTTSQITLVPNKRHWGTRRARFNTVVVRNMIAPTQ